MRALVLTLSLAACAAAADDDELTRGAVYAAVRPGSCDRIQRCAPDQFAREYRSRGECLVKGRPSFPRSAETSPCRQVRVDACIAAERDEPCHAGGVAACKGC